MTSIILDRLSPVRMLAASDKEVTYGKFREANIASKLNVKGPYVTLGSGFSGNIDEIETLFGLSPCSDDLGQQLEMLKDSFYKVYINDAEDQILRRDGLTLKEYQTGVLKNGKNISPQHLGRLSENMNNFSSFNPNVLNFGTTLLFGGYNSKTRDMEMYSIYPPRKHLKSRYFDVQGSGRDRTHIELSDFFESLPVHKRDNVSLRDGLYITLRALVKSEKNVGVGGVPDIGILEKGRDVEKMDELTSRVMRNLTVKEIRGEIGTGKVKRLLEGLARKELDACDVSKKFSKSDDMSDYDYTI